MTSIQVVHASGKYDRNMFVPQDVIPLRKVGSVITHTETGRILSPQDLEACFGGPRWDYYRGPTIPEHECAIQWDIQVWEPVGPGSTYVLTNLVYIHDKAHGGKSVAPFRATVQRLRHKATGVLVWFVTAHMPLQNTPLRKVVHLAASKGVATLLANLEKSGPVVFMADMNSGWTLADQRDLMARTIMTPANLHSVWEKGVPKTNHTLIDNIMSNLPFVKGDLLPNTHSDHTPMYAEIKLPDPAPAPRPAPKPAPSGKFPGSPVAHPWLRRSARWKRQHPVLWHEILAWRAKNPR